MTIEDLPGEQTLKYKFSSRNQFIKYYVGEEYLTKESNYPNDVSFYYSKDKENPKWTARDYLDAIFLARQTADSLNDFKAKITEVGVPIQPFRMIRFEQGKPKSIQDSVSIFVLGYGWVPIADFALGANSDKRYFEKKETDLILYNSLDANPSVSPIYFRKDTNSPWENLPAEISYKVK